MGFFDLFRRKKKFDLRKACVEAYGEEFGQIYDKLSSGEPVAGFIETCAIIDMIEKVRSEHEDEK